MESKDFKFVLKALSDEGVFSGYASTFAVDRDGDQIQPGAFRKTLQDSGGTIPVLWMHRPDEPVGVSTTLREDHKGLYLEAKLNLEAPRGREAYWLLQNKALKALSIGFRGLRPIVEGSIRKFREVVLMEVSLVTFGANPEALITGVKSVDGEVAEAIRRFVDACKK